MLVLCSRSNALATRGSFGICFGIRLVPVGDCCGIRLAIIVGIIFGSVLGSSRVPVWDKLVTIFGTFCGPFRD